MRLYDVGWRRNVEQVFGMGTKRRWQAWLARVLWGGGWYVQSQFIYVPRSLTDPLFAFSYGAGTQFPRNPRAEDELAELAAELVRLENGMD